MSITRLRFALITSTAMISRLKQENDGAKKPFPCVYSYIKSIVRRYATF